MSKLSSIEELFAGRHFDHEVIILCVRWYLRYNHHALGSEVYLRIRQALEPLWKILRSLVASR